jgi:hypothetical protein
MDASSSAYQIMSYLLLHEDLGMRTNLLLASVGSEHLLRDLYQDLLLISG